MDVILAARELGKAIQADERYIRVMNAQENNDKDTGLQAEITAFNTLRTQLNTELQKEDKDQAAVKNMDAELKSMYKKIFENENMIEFSKARAEMQDMITFVNQIITGSAGGQDPEKIEFQSSCGGDCGGCSGCN